LLLLKFLYSPRSEEEVTMNSSFSKLLVLYGAAHNRTLVVWFSAVLTLLFCRAALAQWPDDPSVNVAISRSFSQEQHPLAVTDGADGAIIVWEAHDGIDIDVFAQRVNASGAVMWTSNASISVLLADQRDPSIVSDGAGGAIVVWLDKRDDAIGGDIYAQRVDASGNVKWAANGIPICTATNVQAYPKLVSDGAGGAIITWRDSRNFSVSGADIYAQRVDASGNIKWATNGVSICAAGGDQLDPVIVADGAGGAIIAWMDRRDFNTGWDIFAQRVNGSGATQWTANGVGYKANGNQTWKPLSPPIVSDGAGGAIIAWEDDYFGASDVDIRCLRINSSGSFPWSPASSWIAGAGGNQVFPQLTGDGSGGAIIAWVDYRNGVTNPDIYAQRVNSSGGALWTGDWGKPVCAASDRQELPRLVSDASGGAIIAWHDYRNQASTGVDIFAQRIDGSGNIKWALNGLAISTASSHQFDPTLVRVKSCNAIIAWTDYRWVGDPIDDTNWDIYAQRVLCDGSLTAPSLTVNEPNGGEKWYVGSQREVWWQGQNFTGPVKIEYSTNGGLSWKNVVASTTDQTYPWTIPDEPSGNCLVRVSDAADGDPSDVSDAPFSIVKAVLNLTAPDGGEVWQAGSQQQITWTSQNIPDNDVMIELSLNNGATYTTVGVHTNNQPSESYSWTVPNSPSTQCRIRISLQIGGVDVEDVSSSTFTISASGNTGTGSNVEVNVGNGVKVTFDNVTSPGETTLNMKTSGPPPPSGFTIIPSGSPVYFDINTTASYTGNIKICIPYNDSGMTQADETRLKLHVYEVPPGQWKDITTSLDTQNNIICGTVSHLSEFALMLGSMHFFFTANTGESYSVVIDNATLDGAQLTNGDEIGVFTPAGLCVGASVWDGTLPLPLTAWADDSQTNDVDGYLSGEKMSFRIWDASAGTTDEYPATPTYSAGNGNFGNGAFARVSLLEAVTSVSQNLALAQGWNWVSLNVEPQNASMESVLSGVANLQIVVNNAGQFYIPNVINSIGNWNVLEGYKIYVSAPAQVSATGKPVSATRPIALTAGWNFVSYLPAAAMSAETALASVLGQLAIVKNDGGAFYIPNVINSMGNMTPGEGYKLYLNADATLAYPSGSVPAKDHIDRLTAHSGRSQHFAFTQRTGESFSVVVHSRGQALRPGDEIGLFTPSGLCVGAGVWDGSGILGISAWADDERTDVVDGFREAEAIHFRLWKTDENREVKLKAFFTSGGDRFGETPFSVVELTSPAIPTSFFLSQNYPNPFNAGTVISYQLPESGTVTVRVYNLMGEQVRTLVNEKQEAGAYSIHWDAKDDLGRFVPSGVYLYRIQTASFSAVRKAVFVK